MFEMDKSKQVLVWRDGKHVVKTLPLSYGGRVGRTTTNNKEEFDLYKRLVSTAKEAKEHA